MDIHFPTWCPREESNLNHNLRKVASYPLNDEGVAGNVSYFDAFPHWRYRVSGNGGIIVACMNMEGVGSPDTKLWHDFARQILRMMRHNSGKMKEMPKLVRGERGASILASLVIVAMLGGTALVADLSNSSRDSQVAASLAATSLPPTPIRKVVTDPKKGAPPVGTFEEQQEKACEERIAASAKAGALVNFEKTTVTKKKGENAGSSDPGTEKKKESDGSEAIVDLCISVYASASHSEATKHEKSSYECRGRLAKISINTEGTAISESSPYKISLKGQCKTIECKPDPGNPEKVECIVGDASGDTLRDAGKFSKDALKIKLDKDDFDSKGIGTTLNKQEDDALQRALEEAGEKHAANTAEVKSRAEAYEKALQELAACKGCSNKDELEQAAKNAEKELGVAEKRYELSRDELDRLKIARVALNAEGGPPGKDGDADKGGCPPNCGPTGSNDSNNGGLSSNGPGGQNTFPPGGGPPPGLGQMFGQALGQALGLGKQCAKTQQEHQQQQQQYQQELQQYSYQRDQWYYQQQYNNARTQPPPPPMPLPAPCFQQGQNCPQAPAQPPQSNCPNGTWKPTYSGACVTSWQCTPGGDGQHAAQISCQPQVADVGMTLSISYACSAGTAIGSGFVASTSPAGSATTTVATPPAGANIATYTLTCTNEGRTATASCNVQVAKPAIVLVANPKTVPSGETSAIGWVTSGMQSCVISSPDLPSFTEQNKNATNVNGTVTTPALSSGATFVLKCTTIGGGMREASTTVSML